MALKANSVMIFKGADAESVLDAGVTYYKLNFVCLDPGPAEANDYSVLVPKSTMDAANNATRLTIVQAALQDKYRKPSYLTNLIDQTFTVT